MTNEQIRESIKSAYIEVKRMSLEGNFDDYYSAYISPNGAIYYSREISPDIVPARAKEGKDRRVFLAKYNGSALPTDCKEKNDLIMQFVTAEQKQGLYKYMEENPNKFADNEELEKFTWLVFNAMSAVAKATDYCVNGIMTEFEEGLEDNYGSEIDKLTEWVKENSNQ